MKRIGKHWEKTILVLVIAAFSAAGADAQENRENIKGKYDWVKGFFFDFNTLYNYERLFSDPAPKFQSFNLSLEFGAGYDFGRVTARLYGGFGFLLGGTAVWSDGEVKSISQGLDASRGHFGIEAGVKVLDTSRFDLIIPLGFLFHWTTYEQKNPSYTQDYNTPYDRKWIYDYTSIVSGLQMKISLGNHISLCIPFSIGYPIVKNPAYEEILRGNYVWSDTKSATYSKKFDVEVFAFSAGIGIRANL